MRIVGREKVWRSHSAGNTPSMTVEPGEVFAVDTELCSGDWYHSLEDTWVQGKVEGGNPAVCIGIRGAKPGDALAVQILDIVPEKLGYTLLRDVDMAGEILGEPIRRAQRNVEIQNGELCWNGSLKIPVSPMVGTLGVAAPGAPDNHFAGPHGGNMDAQELRPGATVYLPVYYGGALLHVGDVHAMQGDGEICNVGGIECRARVTLCAEVIPGGLGAGCVWAEDADYLMAIACEPETDASFFTACGELIRFIMRRYAIDRTECYQLMGQIMHARCTQFVNPTRTYICKAPKAILDKGYKRLE